MAQAPPPTLQFRVTQQQRKLYQKLLLLTKKGSEHHWRHYGKWDHGNATLIQGIGGFVGEEEERSQGDLPCVLLWSLMRSKRFSLLLLSGSRFSW